MLFVRAISFYSRAFSSAQRGRRVAVNWNRQATNLRDLGNASLKKSL
jgi:hypothetical protein